MTRSLVSTALAIACACACAGTAAAQPGATPPHSPPQRPLSDEELELLGRGEISDGAYVGGGLIGTFFGFGLGHAVQGRFVDKGWIFMAGEAGSVALLAYGMGDCYSLLAEQPAEECGHDGAFVLGLVGFLGFHVWELIDVWTEPPAHNARVRAVRMRAGLPAYGLFAAPSLGRGDAGGVAGLTLRF